MHRFAPGHPGPILAWKQAPPGHEELLQNNHLYANLVSGPGGWGAGAVGRMLWGGRLRRGLAGPWVGWGFDGVLEPPVMWDGFALQSKLRESLLGRLLATSRHKLRSAGNLPPRTRSSSPRRTCSGSPRLSLSVDDYSKYAFHDCAPMCHSEWVSGSGPKELVATSDDVT